MGDQPLWLHLTWARTLCHCAGASQGPEPRDFLLASQTSLLAPRGRRSVSSDCPWICDLPGPVKICDLKGLVICACLWGEDLEGWRNRGTWTELCLSTSTGPFLEVWFWFFPPINVCQNLSVPLSSFLWGKRFLLVLSLLFPACLPFYTLEPVLQESVT